LKTKYLKAKLQKTAKKNKFCNAEKTTAEALIFIVFGFLPMEDFFYVIHHHLFHGMLWKTDSTHHKTQKELWKTNDIFSLIFDVFSLLLFSSIVFCFQ